MARRREFDEATVVAQAMDLFWLRGYRSATPQALTEVTGLSKSSLYATFGSKQGLFLASLQHYIDGQVQLMGAVLAEGRLRHGLERMYDALLGIGTTGRTCLVCTSTIEGPLEDAAVAEVVRRGHGALEQVLFERIVRAQAEGDVDASRDPRHLARFVLTNNMGLMVLARANPDPAALRGVVAEIVRAVC
ncbi:MAG: TetR/AcrR family transcriptional repressor of nem operon [Myxococcota bacterium]|jgi:TetR/AcrR family transcriptional repressor of nem operon